MYGEKVLTASILIILPIKNKSQVILLSCWGFLYVFLNVGKNPRKSMNMFIHKASTADLNKNQKNKLIKAPRRQILSILRKEDPSPNLIDNIATNKGQIKNTTGTQIVNLAPTE